MQQTEPLPDITFKTRCFPTTLSEGGLILASCINVYLHIFSQVSFASHMDFWLKSWFLDGFPTTKQAVLARRAFVQLQSCFFFFHSHHSACICKSLLSWQLQWLIFHWFKCKEVMFDLENPFNKFFIQLMLSQTVSNAHFYMTWQQVYFKTWITSNIKWKKFLSPKKP